MRPSCSTLGMTYHPVFCVSSGSSISVPSASRSKMFITPGAAAELFLRAATPSLAPSLGGDEARPWTAESTLLSGSVILMDVGSFEYGEVVNGGLAILELEDDVEAESR
jgi:hypothetical protein